MRAFLRGARRGAAQAMILAPFAAIAIWVHPGRSTLVGRVTLSVGYLAWAVIGYQDLRRKGP